MCIRDRDKTAADNLDLNSDGKVDMVDLQYFAVKSRDERERQASIEESVSPSAVTIQVDESKVQVEGNLESLLTGEGNGIVLKPAQGNLSKENPVKIDFPVSDGKTAVVMGGMSIAGNTDNLLTAGGIEVELEDGTRLRYSKLIYALGSECFIPPIPGTDKKQVVAIRRLSDTQKIAALLPGVKNVVVIGGGVLGLEAAWELRKAKCKVTVLELSPQLMGRQLDEPASEMLRLASESQGIEILTGVQIVEIQGDDKVTGVLSLIHI